MSTDTATAPLDAAHDDGHAHPTDLMFVKVAVLLAAVTAVEVAWSYLPWPDRGLGHIAEVGGLLIMMGFKFFMVANVFMHLKFDNKLLTAVFYFGLILAVCVYLAVLFTFQFFTGEHLPYA